MTPDLKEHIEALPVRLYRISDGSIIVAEETHRDIAEEYVILKRPLQITNIVENNTLRNAFLPWMPGAEDSVKLTYDRIIADMDASFDHKFAYSRYYLMDHLKKYLGPNEMKNIVENECAQAPIVNKNPSIKSLPDLKNALAKGKRFHLN